jgi:hypothetical protein
MVCKCTQLEHGYKVNKYIFIILEFILLLCQNICHLDNATKKMRTSSLFLILTTFVLLWPLVIQTREITESTPAPLDANGGNIDLCNGCIIVVRLIEGFLEQNSTIHYVEEQVKRVCVYMRDEYRAVCGKMIEQMTPEIIQILIQRENPKVVCSQLALCTYPSERLYRSEKRKI